MQAPHEEALWSNLLREIALTANQLRRTVIGRNRVGLLAAPEGRLLHHLHRFGPQTVPQIARAYSTSRQNVQIQVNRLAAEGWLELAANPAHKRSALVRLAREGEHALESAATEEARLVQAFRSEFSDLEAESTIALLRRMRQRLTEVEGDSLQPFLPKAPDQQPQTNPRTKPKPTPRLRPQRKPTPSASPGASQEYANEMDEPTELPVNLL